jgi:hypothetical protein
MYAAIRRYEGLDAQTAAETSKLATTGMRSILASSPGFVSYTVVVGDGSVASVSVFETKEQAEASNAAAAKWVQENLAGKMPAPQVTAGEAYLD